ncbi:hypothetical protein HII31_11058 [Pseudocercospora fuligena]|uniref:G-protein coupled receptors family 1 profile domain-containing protein n=1 Tax=Pseudocercospora fuligena TaxID=685502 RepID=A0A8H6R9U6_9PEZI|nr:hypothetical protein HII31_11058 [Pseudocercospora fuligena]
MAATSTQGSIPDIGSPLTLPHLSPSLKHGLAAIAGVALISLVSASILFLCLAYRLITWKRRSQGRANQFIILIFNLILADVLQSVAFVLNARHVLHDSVASGTTICRAQAWFVSTGDLASGLFTFAIATHSFVDIIFDYRLSHRSFMLTIIGLWSFNYLCAIIGIAMHPADFYTRAGAWCWVNQRYINERLWLHYFWMIIAEFGTLILYGIIFIILRKRVQKSFYTNADMQIRAQSAAKMVIAYPIIYVVCTLPLVVARLKNMTGVPVSYVELCISGAMITSNGWLDVLLYSITRKSLLFGPDMSCENLRALDTFNTFTHYRPDYEFGTSTTIEATMTRRSRLDLKMPQPSVIRHQRNESSEELCHLRGTVKAETVVQISSEAMELDKVPAIKYRETCDQDDIATLKFRSSFETSTKSEA